MSALPDLGVVIVHFHREREVANVVRQVVAAGVSATHIVVADNGSTPGALQHELDLTGTAVAVRRFDNAGYAAAVNACVRDLPATVAVVATLTHEVDLAPDCLQILRQTLHDHAEVGLVGPLLVERGGARTGAVWSAGGDYLRGWHVPIHRAQGLRTVPPGHSPRCRWLDGSVLVLRRSVWQTMGGLDERYFLYHEDVDLGWRVERLGLQVWNVTAACAWQESGGHLNSWLSTRNMTLLLRSQRRWWPLVLWVAQAMVRTALALLPPRSPERIAEASGRLAGLRAGVAGMGGRPPARFWP